MALPPRVDFEDTHIETWFERDRAHVELIHSDTRETIVEWWDEDVEAEVEDGFLDPRNWHRSAFERAVELGIIAEGE